MFFTEALPYKTCSTSTCMAALPVCFLFRNLCQNSMKQDIHRSSASMFHFLLLNSCRMLFVPPLFVNQSSAYCMLFTVHCIVMKSPPNMLCSLSDSRNVSQRSKMKAWHISYRLFRMDFLAHARRCVGISSLLTVKLLNWYIQYVKWYKHKGRASGNTCK